MAYVYQITNDINNKIYIGATKRSLKRRFIEHCKDAFYSRNNNRPLYVAMRKYGVDHFKIELIEETDFPKEREVFWIEQKRAFKNGYNATFGGSGKRYLDYDVIIATYKEIGVIKETAKLLGISQDTISTVLHNNNVPILSSQFIQVQTKGKITNMYSLDGKYLHSFSSINEAARYMIENNLTKCKMTTIKCHIAEVCDGKRKTAARYIWKHPQ